jgi:hypothetical protein
VKGATVDDDEHDSDREIDRMFLRVPGGKFHISGRNASQAFWMVFVVAAILALGSAIPNIIEALRK